MSTVEIDKRYSELAENTCCLSCGGAINYSDAKPGEVCVDLGSGRGTDVIRLAEAVGDKGFVYGIDIAEGMIKKAGRNAEKLGVKNVEFKKTELTDTGLKENSVDLMISNCTINHVSDKERLWKEVYRYLKCGGRFAVSDIYSLEDVPEEYKNDPIAVAECWAGAVTKEEYLKILNNVGFESIKILEESVPYDKGKIKVASFTIGAYKPTKSCCC